MKTILILILILAGLISCKKEKVHDLPPPNSPVFSATGTINGEPISINAGENGFTMETLNGTYNNIGIAGGILSNGNEELEFFLFDENILNPSNVFNLSENDQLQYAYISQESYALLKNSLLIGQQNVQSVEWYVDGVYKGENNVEIKQPGLYDVSAIVTFNDGESFTINNKLLLGFSENANASIHHQIVQGLNLKAGLNLNATEISSVSWYLDNNFISNDLNLHANITGGRHVLTADFTHVDGSVYKRSILINRESQSEQTSDFSIFKLPAATQHLLDLKGQIIYRKDGKEYKSSNDAGNNIHAIPVSQIEYYGQSTEGNLIVKGTMQINCNLKENSTGENLTLNLNCKFAFRIP